MPLTISLTDNEASVFGAAVKTKNIEFTIRGRTLTLTRANIIPIRQAVNDLHHKKMGIKSKTIEHMETCYHAQALIRKIDSVASEFGPMPEYDEAEVPVNTSDEVEPTETTTEEYDYGADVGGEILPDESFEGEENNGNDE